jgi:peptidoglycan/xylan/chitin deacetylase (PgdA/CDA1 family)
MDLKNLIKTALYCGGYYKFRYMAKTSRQKRLLILMYHDLIDNDKGRPAEQNQQGKLTRIEFEDHLRVIKAGARSLPVEEAVKEIRYEGGLKENTIAITFDDGYASAYGIAFPLLKKHGLSATIYLPTDWINGKISLWWEDLSDMITGYQPDDVRIDELAKISRDLKIESSRYMSDGKVSKKILFQDLSFELMKTSDSRKKTIMDDLRGVLFGGRAYKRTEVRSITWEQASEMADAGIMFGAHTCSHLNLSFTDMKSAENEIAGSKREMETRLGREIKGFAYPYGYDVAGYARFIPLLEKLGFDHACTSWWGNNTDDSNLFQLLRNNLPPLRSRTLLKRELYIDLSE